MANLDYRNRAMLISDGTTYDGTEKVSLYYDRYDNVMYYVTAAGALKNMDGTTYTPSDLPNTNSILGFTLSSTSLASIQFQNAITDGSFTGWSLDGNGVINTITKVSSTYATMSVTVDADTVYTITTTTTTSIGDIITNTATSSYASPPVDLYKGDDLGAQSSSSQWYYDTSDIFTLFSAGQLVSLFWLFCL